MTAVEGTTRIVRLLLRTGWRRLLLWWGACTALVVATCAGTVSLYPEASDRATYAATLGRSTATAAFNGRGYDLHTLGGIGAYEVGFLGQLFLPVAALLLAVRHTRTQEQSGLVELVTAHRAGSLAPLLAGAVVTALPLLGVGIGVATGLCALGLPVAGAVRYAVVLTAMMICFAAVGLLSSELAQGARTATMLGLGMLGAAFLGRVVVDALQLEATWISPLGWVAEARPWGGSASWWPTAAYLATALVLGTVAVTVRLHRDLGSGVVAPRPGPPHGRPRTSTVFGWPLRLTRGSFTGWLVATLVWSGSFGFLAHEMTSLIRDNPALMAGLGISNATDLVTTLVGVFDAGLACLAGIGVTMALRTEEDEGRLGAVLAGRASRLAVWCGWSVVACGQALALLAAGLATYGLSSAAVTGDGHVLRTALELAVAYAVPVVVVVAGSLALAAWLPAATPAAWALVAWILVVGLLADSLRLPEWARTLSPVDAVGDVPARPPSALALVVLGVLATLLLGATVAGGRRRDLRAG